MEVIKNDENTTGENLIERHNLEETPFTIITIGGKSFGTFGKYRITEERDTRQEVEEELYLMTWNRVIQIMTLVHEILTNKN